MDAASSYLAPTSDGHHSHPGTSAFAHPDAWSCLSLTRRRATTPAAAAADPLTLFHISLAPLLKSHFPRRPSFSTTIQPASLLTTHTHATRPRSPVSHHGQQRGQHEQPANPVPAGEAAADAAAALRRRTADGPPPAAHIQFYSPGPAAVSAPADQLCPKPQRREPGVGGRPVQLFTPEQLLPRHILALRAYVPPTFPPIIAILPSFSCPGLTNTPYTVLGKTSERMRDPSLRSYESINTDCMLMCGISRHADSCRAVASCHGTMQKIARPRNCSIRVVQVLR